jgi:hypothetical protein
MPLGLVPEPQLFDEQWAQMETHGAAAASARAQENGAHPLTREMHHGSFVHSGAFCIDYRCLLAYLACTAEGRPPSSAEAARRQLPRPAWSSAEGRHEHDASHMSMPL